MTNSKTIQKKIKEVEALVGNLETAEKQYMSEDLLDAISQILEICKIILGQEPEYKLDENGKIFLDNWQLPEVVTYSFEKFSIKQLIDFQFQLAGLLGYIGISKARFEGNTGLAKAVLDITSNYIYTDVKDYIQEVLRERRTEKYIESIISQKLLKKYAVHRVSASIARILETVWQLGSLMRNVLNSTIEYMKEDSLNSLHLAKSQL